MRELENFDQFKKRLIASLPAGTVKIELIEFLDGHKIDKDIQDMLKLIEQGEHT